MGNDIFFSYIDDQICHLKKPCPEWNILKALKANKSYKEIIIYTLKYLNSKIIKQGYIS